MTADTAGIRIVLAGDVMLGRGIDQALPHPGDPHLFEDYASSARHYLELAENANGPIGAPLQVRDPWRAALKVLGHRPVADRIVNLETAITRRGRPEPKGINYRMSPANLPCLAALAPDCCVLANNHALDWGTTGLGDTLDALERADIAVAGAGRTAADAEAPAILPRSDGGRILVFAAALPSSGVPARWAATGDRPGVAYLPDTGTASRRSLVGRIREHRRPEDVVVASLHWGPNWSHAIGTEERAFAHALIDEAGVDVVHGHSSHHPKAVEVHRDRPILYGCGDLMNDYEGIHGYEWYRGDLVLLYELYLDAREHRCRDFIMWPFRIRRFRLTRPDEDDLHWLHGELARECGRFGGRVVRRADTAFVLAPT